MRIGQQILSGVEILEMRGDPPICRPATTVRNLAGEDCVTGTAVSHTVALWGGAQRPDFAFPKSWARIMSAEVMPIMMVEIAAIVGSI